MNASALPYHLRPHKTVDRRLFIDLLARYERWRPLSRFAYIGMGAYALEDHRLIHRLLGLTRLVAFDREQRVVNRQIFNRPITRCHCVAKASGKLIDTLDDTLRQAEAADADGVIVWLDYTAPKALGEQVREFETLLDKLTEGDVVRVTVNAHPPSLGDSRSEDGRPLDEKSLREKRLETLQDRIGDFMPEGVSSEDVRKDRLPSVLARAFGQAAAKALPTTGRSTFAPLSIIRYSDAQQMLSMTGAIVDRSKKEEMRQAMAVDSWPFSSAAWTDVHALTVPVLTLRERMFLEQAVTSEHPDDIAGKMGFEFEDGSLSTFIDDFRRFYRFYPNPIISEV